MENQIAVSVIMPIYNAERFLKQSIDSILAQTFTNFELICVDDGSSDSTPQILADYCRRDHRVSIIKQKNQYAGVARNNGMKKARGEYLLFLDADDFINANMIEKMYGKAKEDKADICVCNVNRFNEKYQMFEGGKAYMVEKLLPETIPFSRESAERTIFNFTTMHVWNKLFRAAFIFEHDINFKPYKIAEDTGFVLSALTLAKSITVVKERLINYRVASSVSLTDHVSENILAGYETMMEEKKLMVERGVYTEGLRQSFANKALGNCLLFFNHASTLETYTQLYNKLVKENGFKDLDIMDRENYYYGQASYKRLKMMLQCKDAAEFLFFQYRMECERTKKLAPKVMKLKQDNKKLKSDIKKIKNSRSYKLGKMITWIPRKLK